jgi:hypothetical protein
LAGNDKSYQFFRPVTMDGSGLSGQEFRWKQMKSFYNVIIGHRQMMVSYHGVHMRYKSVYRQWRYTGLFLAGIVMLTSTFAWTKELAVSDFARDGLTGWKTKIFAGETAYQVVQDDGRVVVQAVSQAAASCLIKEIEFQPAEYPYLRWSWKIDKTIEGGDEKTKAGDDYAARLYVVFPGRFFWQTRAINYIWANQLAENASIANAYTAQAMMVAVRSGPASAGRWMFEERDIRADYLRLFGEEPKEAAAIAIMTDTDNTAASAVAWYGDIVLAETPRQTLPIAP